MCNEHKAFLGENIERKLAELQLPDLLKLENGEAVTADNWEQKRAELKRSQSEYQFGVFPDEEMQVTVKEVGCKTLFDGKGIEKELLMTLNGKRGEFSFPFTALLPQLQEKRKIPAFVQISFADLATDPNVPKEEMCDRGYALFAFRYTNVTSDDGDFANGLVPYIFDEQLIKDRKVGKFAVWAYAAGRVMDYVLTQEEIDGNRVAVVGHSRLGKSALVTGAYDERFAYVIGNNSGCCGAAPHRGKTGERIKNITDVFPYWFTDKLKEYADKETEAPFDQNELLALVVPRYVYACSAELDAWSHPEGEFLGVASVSKAYELFGKKGLVAEDFPKIGDAFHEGSAGYHIRAGGHDILWEDWHQFMDFIEAHK